jgi:hypothetical protein
MAIAGMITVKAVNSASALRSFIDLPPTLYAAMPNYSPPLAVDRAMLLDPKQSAFCKKGDVRYWIAIREGVAVGRISAQISAHTPVGIEPGAGMFGCLDSIDDPDVVSALIETAGQWLASNGCNTMFGPCSLDMNEEPGLLVEGAEEPAMTMCPWHPPYLASLLEQMGFDKLHDLHNWRLDLTGQQRPTQSARLRLAERMPTLKVRHPSRKTYARDIQILCDIYNDGWQDNWGFVPLSPTDLAGLDQLMIWLVPREAFKIVEIGEEPVGVVLLIPNLFELTKGLGSRPSPLGWAKLLWRAATHRFRSGRIIVTGVIRRLRGTVVGAAVAGLLIDELVAEHSSLEGEWVEAGWVLEDNRALVQVLERYRFQRNKTFRIFSRGLPASHTGNDTDNTKELAA